MVNGSVYLFPEFLVVRSASEFFQPAERSAPTLFFVFFQRANVQSSGGFHRRPPSPRSAGLDAFRVRSQGTQGGGSLCGHRVMASSHEGGPTWGLGPPSSAPERGIARYRHEACVGRSPARFQFFV